MLPKISGKNSQCHSAGQKDLEHDGFCLQKMDLPPEINDFVNAQNYEALDHKFHELTAPTGILFKALSQYKDFSSIEFIISLRESKNEWEEDGIWHDDGSRVLAFSLSLTTIPPQGGVLEFRKKGSSKTHRIETPQYGKMIVFKTGVEGYEHKINRVSKGVRLIIAGWCS